MIIDTDTNCKSKTDFMVKRGIEVVGRYYSSGSSSKNVTKEGPRLFPGWGSNSFLSMRMGVTQALSR
jgi:hypothetical protein